MKYNDIKRDFSIDNLRAIAIVLVVFGHSIILYSSQWSIYTTSIDCSILDVVKKIINIVQMPVFFSLSGFLFFFTVRKKKKLFEIIKDKFKRLLIPFMIFASIWLVPIRYMVGYSEYIRSSLPDVLFYKILLGYDNGHLWFLPTLYLCFPVTYICLYILQRYVRGGGKYIFLFGISVLLYCEQILFPIKGYIQFLGQYYIWFCFGLLIGYYKNSFLKGWTQLKRLKNLFGICSIGFIILELLKPNIISLNIASFFAVITCYLIIPNKNNKIGILLSENSFGIYLIHSPLVYITYRFFSECIPCFVVGLNFILWGGISLVASIYLRRTRFKWIVGE